MARGPPPGPIDFHGDMNAGDDREDEDEREPDVDSEASLGWSATTNQTLPAWQANNLGMIDLEDGVGPVRKKRPASKTGNRVVVGWRAEVPCRNTLGHRILPLPLVAEATPALSEGLGSFLWRWSPEAT